MDFMTTDLQKIFGATPISYLPNAIALKNKKTQTNLLVAGSAIILGCIAYYAYKKGQESKEKEMAELRRQHQMEQEDEMFAYIQKQNTLKHPRAFAKENMTSVDIEPIEKIISRDISDVESKFKKVGILRNAEKFSN